MALRTKVSGITGLELGVWNRRQDAWERLAVVFMGTFENKVDRKGRVSVPAPFRQSLATSSYPGIVVFRSQRSNSIESCGLEFMNQLSRRADTYDLFSDEHDDVVFTLFADAFQLPFDGEGRIILPPALAAHAEITDRAAFAGKGNTFQIWQPAELARYKETVESRTRSQGFKLPPSATGGGP